MNVDGPGTGEGLYGLEVPFEEAHIRVVAVPWEATASYRRGTRQAPDAILAASQQVDLHDPTFGAVWQAGIAMALVHPEINRWADAAEADALAVIQSDGEAPEQAQRVDAVAQRVNQALSEKTIETLGQGAVPAVLGGDHSVPYAQIVEVARHNPGVGILHIDAHADLREAYLGFRWSHASIFHNVLEHPDVAGLVGVGYRDMGAGEQQRINEDPRIIAFLDATLSRRLARGDSWMACCHNIVEALPDDVYISLDIDGLDPSLCPSTGTPVPGGLSFRDLDVLLELVASHRRVVGFDVCEVGPGEWDAIVGARVLYKLCGAVVRSEAR